PEAHLRLVERADELGALGHRERVRLPQAEGVDRAGGPGPARAAVAETGGLGLALDRELDRTAEAASFVHLGSSWLASVAPYATAAPARARRPPVERPAREARLECTRIGPRCTAWRKSAILPACSRTGASSRTPRRIVRSTPGCSRASGPRPSPRSSTGS